MKFITKALLSLLFLSSCAESNLPSLSLLWKDRLASRDIKNEKYEEALQKYYGMIETSPQFYQSHANVGVLLNMVQKPEDALKSLQYALKIAQETNDLAGQFSVRYNLGVYFGLQKKIEPAIENYQAALEIVPDSKETKTNIELLVQQQQKQNKQGQGQGDSKSDSQDKQQNSGQDKNNKDQKQNDKNDNSDNKDKKDQDKKGEQPKDDQKRENSPRYKPRPFQGDQLSEGDVKKILGELRNQEQKIRANFDKKEKGKTKKNEKDW
ncbi:MAG: tetratricopeptide repeat protein [Pseudobdellovibrio sp.]